MGKVPADCVPDLVSDEIRRRLRQLGAEGSWEALRALVRLRPNLNAEEIAAWREATDDCLERYLSLAPERPPAGDR